MGGWAFACFLGSVLFAVHGLSKPSSLSSVNPIKRTVLSPSLERPRSGRSALNLAPFRRPASDSVGETTSVAKMKSSSTNVSISLCRRRCFQTGSKSLPGNAHSNANLGFYETRKTSLRLGPAEKPRPIPWTSHRVLDKSQEWRHVHTEGTRQPSVRRQWLEKYLKDVAPDDATSRPNWPPHIMTKRSASGGEAKVSQHVDRLVPRASPDTTQSPSQDVGNPRCWGDRLAVRQAARSAKLWAQMMVDSTGRLGPGYLQLDVDMVGVKDQCLSVHVPPLLGFQSQYCVVTFLLDQVQFPEMLSDLHVSALSAGVCLPDTCRELDASRVAQDLVAKKGQVRGFHLDHVTCAREGETALDPSTAAAATFLGLWWVVVVTVTLLHHCFVRRASSAREDRQAQPQRRVMRVHYQRQSDEQQPQQQPSSSSTTDHLTDASAVQIDIDTDGDAVSGGLRPQTQPKSLPAPRPRPNQGNREIRGILRGYGSPQQAARAARCQQIGSLRRFAACFSLTLNLQRLLSTSSSDTEIGCLHGIRVFSLLWVVLANSVMYQSLFSSNASRLFAAWQEHSLLYSFIGNGDLALESFFTLSGLLVGYSYSMRLERQLGKLGWTQYVVQRYWRVVPTLTIVAVVYFCLFPYMADGPLLISRAPGEQTCLQQGWMDVLLVHNFASSGVCLRWTWVLAVDFQLFLLTPGLLLLLYHRRRLAYAAMVVVVVSSWIPSGLLTRAYQLPVSQRTLPAGHNSTGGGVHSFVWHHLHMPWAHAGAFFPPLLLGYFLHRCRRRASLRLRSVLAGWTVVLATFTALLLGPHRQLAGEGGDGGPLAALYNAVQSTAWGACVCWVVVVCSTGYGGALDGLLSWSVWKPLSRLALVVYLVHPMVAFVYNANLGQLMQVTTAAAARYYLVVVLVSLAVSAVVTVTLEMPLTALFSWVTSCCGSAARHRR